MLRYANHMTVRGKIFQILRNPIGSLKERGRLARLLVKELSVFVVNSGNWAKFPDLTLRAANVFPKQFLLLLEIHGYERIYSKFFETYQNVSSIQLLEIGIGTNSHGLISSMGRNGKPGASLITFAEFDSRINVTGADIDRRILFTANRVKCFFIDQTELKSYDTLVAQVGITQFDFIIDDGLHSTEANLNSLIFAQNHLTPGGYLIIEDIPDNSLPVWDVVIGVMRSKGFEISVTRATRCNVVIFRNSL
jgi:hypothetical protein